MNTFFALLSIRTEAGQVESAQSLSDVLLATSGSQWAESFLIMRTRQEFGFRVDVKVQALFAIRAVLGACIMVAFGHAPSVEAKAG